MMTLKGTQPTINVLTYMIIRSTTNYGINVLYYFSTYEIDFVIILEKKRQEFCLNLAAQDVLCQIF